MYLTAISLRGGRIGLPLARPGGEAGQEKEDLQAAAHIERFNGTFARLNCLSSMKKYFSLAALPIVLISCSVVLFSCHQPENKAGAPAAKTDTAASTDETPGVSAALKGLAFAYKKDPSCGMPLSAGLEDTTTYKGKLYGFCSKECKDAFLQDPAGYVAKIK